MRNISAAFFKVVRFKARLFDRKFDLLYLRWGLSNVRIKVGCFDKNTIIFPNIVIWHCSNHRLELAVNNVIKEINAINHFKIFFDKMYSFYHQSSKNQRDLDNIASSLEITLLNIGKIISVRWVEV